MSDEAYEFLALGICVLLTVMALYACLAWLDTYLEYRHARRLNNVLRAAQTAKLRAALDRRAEKEAKLPPYGHNAP